jgi:uncharacterized protein
MFNLKAGNGELILTSEIYNHLASAENGIASGKANVEIDERYKRLLSTRKKLYFVLEAASGEVDWH